MFGKGKNAEERQKEKERKKRGTRKYGQAKYKHSHMGVVSCGCAAAALLLLAGCILYAYLARGAAAGIVSGIAVVSLVLSIMGIRAAVKGFRERERNYLTCKIGLPGSTLVLILFLAIYIGGLS
jgi:hypothetical protein